MDYYGTVEDASVYFGKRLHEFAWSDASPADREKALRAATQRIDALNFKGDTHGLYVANLNNVPGVPQDLEFPRDADTDVPAAIVRATYEIAYNLLDGRDPEIEMEAIAMNSQTFANVRTGYARDQAPPEHIMNMIPSASAWAMLRPFLRDSNTIELNRIN